MSLIPTFGEALYLKFGDCVGEWHNCHPELK